MTIKRIALGAAFSLGLIGAANAHIYKTRESAAAEQAETAQLNRDQAQQSASINATAKVRAVNTVAAANRSDAGITPSGVSH